MSQPKISPSAFQDLLDNSEYKDDPFARSHARLADLMFPAIDDWLEKQLADTRGAGADHEALLSLLLRGIEGCTASILAFSLRAEDVDRFCAEILGPMLRDAALSAGEDPQSETPSED